MKPRDAYRFYFTVLLFLMLLTCAPASAAGSGKQVPINDKNLTEILKINSKSPDSFSFVVLGDSRSFPKTFSKIADLINSLNPDFVIHTGDIAITGQVKEYDEVMPIFAKIKAPLVAVAGNHDLKKGLNGKANWMRYFGKDELTFDIGKIRFILVDNSKGALSKKQNERIRKDLNTNQVRMIFMHAPPAGIYVEHNFKGGAKELVKSIIETGCEYAIFGHIHYYDHRKIGDKCEAYVSGGGGAEITEGYPHHVLYVKVNKDKLEIKMVPLPNEVKKK